MRDQLHFDVKASPVGQSVLLEDGEPAFLDLSVHDGVGGDGDRTDVLGVGVILVPDFEHQLLGEVANFDPKAK